MFFKLSDLFDEQFSYDSGIIGNDSLIFFSNFLIWWLWHWTYWCNWYILWVPSLSKVYTVKGLPISKVLKSLSILLLSSSSSEAADSLFYIFSMLKRHATGNPRSEWLSSGTINWCCGSHVSWNDSSTIIYIPLTGHNCSIPCLDKFLRILHYATKTFKNIWWYIFLQNEFWINQFLWRRRKSAKSKNIN